jgi:ribosomal protein L10
LAKEIDKIHGLFPPGFKSVGMAKSKRAQVVSTSKASTSNPKEKGIKQKETKTKLVSEVKKCLLPSTPYTHVYVYRVNHLKAALFQRLRLDLASSSKLFFARNKVLAASLKGYKCGEKIKDLLIGPMVGIAFTSDPKAFESYVNGETKSSVVGTPDFPRTGDVASETIELAPGALHRLDDGQAISSTLEPFLRTECGLPTTLKGGAVIIHDSQIACQEGEKLSAKQAKLLKALGKTMVHFSITLNYRFNLKEECEEAIH